MENQKRIIKRETNHNTLLLRRNGQTEKVKLDEFCTKNKVDGVMKIRKEDHYYASKHGTATLPNLQVSGHKKGKKYALLKILECGYYKNANSEKLPILSCHEMLIGECTSVKEQADYEKITDDDLENSPIKNVEDLKKSMLKRYTKSLPNSTKKEIIDAGASLTTLKILRTQTAKKSHTPSTI